MRRIVIAAVIMALLMSGCIAAIQETEPGAAQPTVEELLADALKYYNAGNYEEAILLYETVIEIEPRNFDATIGLGRSFRGAKRNPQAVEALKAAYELNASANVAYELGCAYIANGQYTDAESFSSGLWNGGKGDNKAGTVLLLSLAAQEKIEEVIELLQNESFIPFLNPGKGNDFLYMGGYDGSGRCSGYGAGIYSGGYIYAGRYKDGVRCGQGTWYSCTQHQQGMTYFTGEWADDAPNGYGEYHIVYREYSFSVMRSGNYTDGYENGEMTVSFEDHVAPYVSNMGIRQLTGDEYKPENESYVQYYYAICKTHKGQCNGNWVIGEHQVNAQWGVEPWGVTKTGR